jgi:large subunit ribosomal protein L31e
MAIERIYNVPLRREWLKVPKYKRAKKAIFALKRFLSRHMKSENILIGKRLNEFIWQNGIKVPPHHVKINVIKEDDGKVYAELFGFKYEKAVEIKEEKKGIEGKTETKEEKLEKKTEEGRKEKAAKGAEKEKMIEKMEKKEETDMKKKEHKPRAAKPVRDEKVRHLESPNR